MVYVITPALISLFGVHIFIRPERKIG